MLSKAAQELLNELKVGEGFIVNFQSRSINALAAAEELVGQNLARWQDAAKTTLLLNS